MRLRLPSPPELPPRLTHEVRLARREIREGRFQRSMAVITAFSAIVSGFEAYSQHQRGAFRHPLMWTPVWLTFPLVAAAVAALFRHSVARAILAPLSAVMLLDGVVGFVLHLRGIARLPGGFRLGQYNIVMGPPIFAPPLMCVVGMLGLLAGLLRQEVAQEPGWRTALVSTIRFARRPAQRGRLSRIAYDLSHGRFQRTMALISASLALLAGGEAYFEHLRGSFNQRIMWMPVWVTPPMVAGAIASVRSETVARRALPVVSSVVFLVGLLGFVLHGVGIRRMPGGLGNLEFKTTLGPPVFAPLLFTSVGLMGFLASILRRR